MAVLERLLDQRRMILTGVILLSISGLAAWITMNRQEDPRMPAYWGQVVAVYPGADAETVERQILEPIEDALAEVEAIAGLESTAYAETAVVKIDLDETTRDTSAAWDDVRDALIAAHAEFPAGLPAPTLNDSLNSDHDAVVVAITGSADPVALLDGARTVRRALLGLSDVARVKLLGDPGEQATIELDDAAARRLGLSPDAVAAQLAGRARIVPGGSLAVADRTVRLRPLSEYESVEEIAASPLRLPSGATVPLGAVARVRKGPAEPASQRMRIDGELAVGLGVVADETAHAVRFGDAVRRRLDEVTPRIAPLELRVVTFQPDRVETRLAELNGSLLMGILIVAGVLVLSMGLRLGLVVASVVPLVTFAALAAFAAGGGVLHQISIAALVLSLGMLVDNAIVVAENIQRRLDGGATPRVAAAEAVRELAKPLAAATGTTVAAFLPMLLAGGSTADFTRSIPTMVILTLSVSYLFAVMVTPALSELVLRPSAGRGEATSGRFARFASRLAVERTAFVLAAATALVALSIVGAGFVRQQFFPGADRNQFVVDLRLPEGSHLDATDAASRRLERLLLEREGVTSVSSFMGRGAPRFYYNIEPVPWSPHFAQLIVETEAPEDVPPILAWLHGATAERLPGVEVIGKRLEQGPPVGAPIQVRVFADDLGELADAVSKVSSELRATGGAIDVRHDLGAGEPALRFRIDDAAAARHGLSRADVARTLYGRTRGLPVGELRSDEDPVPIVVRSSAGERLAADALPGLDVPTPDGRAVPLAEVARFEPSWRPAVVHHRDRARMATVAAQLAPGATFTEVLHALGPRLAALDLPSGVRFAFGGEAEGAGEANVAILRMLPLGLLVLLGVLMAEFNSFRRVGLILVTVPLAATGVVPGLLVSGEPFGFMSVLGVFALVGIVVNNAIVLLEVIEDRRRAGAPIDDALADAIGARIRPILLTTATTVSGLLPLAFSSSTLWPPLAWAMISGLVASTALTLVVVPALYRVIFRDREEQPASDNEPLALAATASLLLVLLLTPRVAAAEALPFDEALRRAGDRPAATAADEGARAVERRSLAERRSGYLPSLTASYLESERDRGLELRTPIGNFDFGAARVASAGIELAQPLFDPARRLGGGAASRLESDAARLESRRVRDGLVAAAGESHLAVLAAEARIAATDAYVASLRARFDETMARVDAGRALESDALKIRLALESAELDRLALAEGLAVARAELARAIGADGEMDASEAPDWTARPVPELSAATSVARSARPDVAALAAAVEALDRRVASVRAERLPRLDARVAWSWTDGSPYVQKQWTEGAVVMSWNPFASGTRAPRVAALESELEAARARLGEAERTIAIELRRARARLVTAREAVAVGERAVGQATESVRVERERADAGRVTTNDLLAAEAELRDRRTNLELARLDVVRAWLGWWYVAGGGDVEALLAGA